MNMDSFDMILTILALGAGILLLTGHGDILMKGGNAGERKKLYDEKKMQRASGVTMIIFGHLTGADFFIDSYIYEIVYLVLVIAIFVGLVIYIRKKCKK